MSVRSPYATKIGRGTYSAIVFADGDYIVAEKDDGTIIAEGTNAATVINAGVDSLPANGGLVFLKDKFTTTATITIDTPGVILMGDSWRNSGLETTADIPTITVTSTGTKAIIEKLWLKGANDVLKTNNHGIYFSGTSVKYDILLRDIFMDYFYDGIKGYKVGYLNIDNLRCYHSKHDGIYLTGDSSDYSTMYLTNSYFKDYTNLGIYTDYLMGSKLVNVWLEGNSVGARGLEMHHGFASWFSHVDCENHTGHGALVQDETGGTVFASCWFSGNGDNGFWDLSGSGLTLSDSHFYLNQSMGAYAKDTSRVNINNCYALNNSQTGVSSYNGFCIENVSDSILAGLHAYDDQGTKKQKYGIQSLGTSNYNIVNGCNCRGNATGGISLVGANNINTNNLS